MARRVRVRVRMERRMSENQTKRMVARREIKETMETKQTKQTERKVARKERRERMVETKPEKEGRIRKEGRTRRKSRTRRRMTRKRTGIRRRAAVARAPTGCLTLFTTNSGASTWPWNRHLRSVWRTGSITEKN